MFVSRNSASPWILYSELRGDQQMAVCCAVPSKSSGNHRRALESAVDGG